MKQQAKVRDEKQTTMRTCGFTLTTTGRPCANHVAEDELCCRAGHPCPPGPVRLDPGGRWTPHPGHVFPLGTDASSAPVTDRRRRAELLLARSLSHEDAEADGVCADRLLADPAIALALLGSPDAAPEARDAVIQRFGLVGALLVVAHEDRWQRHLAVLSADAGKAPAGDDVARNLERLVKNFPHIDAPGLEALLIDIDRAEGVASDDEATAARHRLHAAYAVAARDGSNDTHHRYMESLNEVLKVTRPSVAS